MTGAADPRAELDRLRAVVARLEAGLAESRGGEAGPGSPEAQLRSAFDDSPVGMAIEALDGQRHLRVNGALGALVGFTPEELLALSPGDLVHGEDREQEGDLRARLRAGTIPSYQCRKRLVRKDGRTVWTLNSVSRGRGPDGAPRYLVRQVQDLSDQMRTEEGLRLQAAAVEAAANAIMITDRAGVIVWANPAFAALSGYPVEEVIGQTPRFLKTHRQDAAFYREMWTTILDGQVWHGELRNRRRDGSEYVESQTITPVRNAGGEVTHFVAIKQDVTAVRQAETDLRLHRDALYQSEKLAAMGQLVAGVAHELNNPLAVVIGQAFLLSQQAGPGPLAQRTEKLARAAERCSRIVKNFLALARQYPPERSEVALNQLARDAVDLLAYPLRVDSVTVELDLAEGVPSLWADRHQLSQVLVNLVANAHQAMRAVPASRRRLTISTRAWPDRSGVRLAVADTGPGVPPEIERRIFEPFFTTKAPGEGTGLGLSLCQGIVESHGGRIGVESDRGAGARFWVDLSVGREPAAPPKADPATPPIASQRILVVDDEPEVGELIREILSTDGHLVDVCSDGRAALARLDGQQYDMILSDIRMPQLDGPGLYLELEQRRDPVLSRFVFVTGDVLDARTRDLIARARVASLHKPFTAAGLREVIRRVRARGA